MTLDDPFTMDGKVVIVTGSGLPGGIGGGIARVFADAGAHVVLSDVHAAPGLDELRSELAGARGRILAECADLAIEQEVQDLVRRVLEQLGHIHVLVNNAAAQHGSDKGDPARVATTDLDAQLDVNVRGTFLLIRECIPVMRRQQWGRIVNIASQAGRVGMKDRAVYSASKAAILGMTRALALDLAQDRITVNAVCPGPIETDRLRSTVAHQRSADPSTQDDPAEGLRRWASTIPVGRLGQPQDIGLAALFFALPASDFITAQTLGVDGGAFAL